MTKYIILAAFILIIIVLVKLLWKIAIFALIVAGIYYFYKFFIAGKRWKDVDF